LYKGISVSDVYSLVAKEFSRKLLNHEQNLSKCLKGHQFSRLRSVTTME